VHKSPHLKPDTSRLSPFAVLPPARQIENLYPSNLTYSEIVDEWDDFKKTKTRWNSNEKATRTRMESLFTFAENPETPTNEPLPPAGIPFTNLRDYLTGMHFAKESLSDDERTMLWWAESILTKIDGESSTGFVR